MEQQAIVDWFDADYDKDAGFGLAPRAMLCCGAKIPLNGLIYDPPFAFARFGFRIMNPQWKFREALASERAAKEMRYRRDWTRAEQEEWRARHEEWSADVRAGEGEIAARLGAVLGCRIIVVYEHQ